MPWRWPPCCYWRYGSWPVGWAAGGGGPAHCFRWRQGSRAGGAALAVGLAVVSVGHVVFWPGVLKIWAYWLPDPLTPFLNPWREISGAELFWNPGIGVGSRVGGFFSGFRLHLFPWLGVLVSFLFQPGEA